MRTIFKLLSLSLLAPLCFGTLQAKDEAAPDKAPKKAKVSKEPKADKEADTNYISKTIPSWANPTATQNSLASKIRSTLKSPEPERVVKFVESPKNRLLVAQYMLAQFDTMTPEDMIRRSREKDANTLDRLPDEIKADKNKLKTLRGKERTAFASAIRAKEATLRKLKADIKNQAPWTLSELSRHRDGSKVLKQVTGNLEWMENICFSGPCVAPGRVLYVISMIAKKHPDVYKDKVVRDIATAIGLEWARYGYDLGKVMDRADFYIEHWKEGRLNVIFDTLPMYLRRIVCGCKGENIAGDRVSLEWALDNVHVAAERYMGSPHRLGYRLYNLFGDSIHGAQYYMPWDHIYGGNHFTRSLYVGCVCGGISHFGAFAAVANGVPALTNGEPGHCAYILWLNGKWTPGNTVSWERDPHWQPILNMWGAFSSLHLGSELYEKLDPDTHASNVYRVLAHQAAARKDKNAINYFKDAVTAQPINIAVWQEYNNFLSASKADDMKLLSNLHDDLCYLVAPRYPEVVSTFLSAWVYPKMKNAQMAAKDLMPRYHAFWDNVRDMGPERWKIEKFGRRQIELLAHQDPPDGKEIPPPAPERAIPVYKLMMNNLASKADYLPVMMGWGDELAKGIGGADGTTITTLTKDISKTATGAMGGGDNTKVTGQMMMAAAKAKDIATFQRLGANCQDKMETPGDMPELPDMPGKLLSENGLLATSSTCNHDSAISHWNVLRPCGGRFHTGKDENAWASVMLPKPGYVNGVVIVTTNGNHHRLNNMVVQISDDGQSWTDLKSLGNCNQRVIKIEFQEHLGRHIRILRKGGPEFFHLNGIYVYGRDAA